MKIIELFLKIVILVEIFNEIFIFIKKIVNDALILQVSIWSCVHDRLNRISIYLTIAIRNKCVGRILNNLGKANNILIT